MNYPFFTLTQRLSLGHHCKKTRRLHHVAIFISANLSVEITYAYEKRAWVHMEAHTLITYLPQLCAVQEPAK